MDNLKNYALVIGIVESQRTIEEWNYRLKQIKERTENIGKVEERLNDGFSELKKYESKLKELEEEIESKCNALMKEIDGLNEQFDKDFMSLYRMVTFSLNR